MSEERWRAAAVGVLSVLLAAGAVALILGPLDGLGPASHSLVIPWWLLVPAFTLTELLVVHVQARRESMTLSFSEVPLVLGLAFCDPSAFVAASVLGAAIGLVHQRQLGLKLLFNLSSFALEAAVAQLLYHAVLGGDHPASVRGFVAALVTAVAVQALTAALVTLVIYLKVGEYDEGVIAEAMSSALAAALANASVGLLIVVLATTHPWALLLLMVVVGILIVAYRGYSALSRGHARLNSLYLFTERTGGVVRTGDVVDAVLRQARDVLTTETAELVLLDGSATGGGRRSRLTDTGLTHAPLEDGVHWWSPAAAGTPVLVRRDETGTVREGLAAPLKVDDDVVGVLLVADRPHHLDTFGDTDLRLFTSLTNHAALSLHKAQLLDRLQAEAAAQEHMSLHDPLTGLPNRRAFLRSADAHLATDPLAAILVIDLDGFKDVNDALGHDTGDVLLVELGRMLREHVGDRSARLGNDEFAVLVPHEAGGPDVVAHAQALLAALARPVHVRGLNIDVRLTGGLAQGSRHGREASTLLQRADTALYAAKVHQQGRVGVYDPARDVAATRLEMTGHLRESIAGGALEVHYQPKVDAVTGATAGAEALLRWTHPAYGRVSPDEFVTLAEHTGLIRPLTDFVLATALADCATWRRDGHEFGVAVNLSTRSLVDPALPSQVRDALQIAGVPASALTLEITETAVMSDLSSSLQVLHGLRLLGVRLSIDDFGTGQSSLAYLKTLPVDEVKIDKSFVLALSRDAGDAAIVRATIGLGHALGLRVVAEGVEDAETLTLLAQWRCDLVQGYHLSRPLPLGELETWLSARRDAVGRDVLPQPV